MNTSEGPIGLFEITCSEVLEEIPSEGGDFEIGPDNLAISDKLQEIHDELADLNGPVFPTALTVPYQEKGVAGEFRETECTLSDIENMGSNTISSERKLRRSSIKARKGIKKLIEIENESAEPEQLAHREESSQFFGVNKRNKNNLVDIIADIRGNVHTLHKQNEEKISPMIKVIKPKGFIPHRILQEMTNSTSPKKDAPVNPGKLHHEEKELPERAKFFHDDLDFLKKKKSKPKPNKTLKKAYKKYLRIKEKNTRRNRAYVTILPRRKAVIGLYSIPKTIYRKGRSDRRVYFDQQAPLSVHNSTSDVAPILVEEDRPPKFEWTKEKEPIDIVRRVDLTSEISMEDFVFRRLGNSVGT